MLIRFGVANFGPFPQPAHLDMRALKSVQGQPRAVLDDGARTGSLLKACAIYGANASGKSSLIAAMKCFRTLLDGAREGACPLRDAYRPFLFSNETRDADTEYEIYLRSAEQAEYHYGFTHNAQKVSREYLYRKNPLTGRTVTVFERAGREYRFGGAAAGAKKAVGMISDDLLAMPRLSALLPENPSFRDAFDCARKLTPVACTDGAFMPGNPITALADEEREAVCPALRRFLRSVDAGIRDIVAVKENGETRIYARHDCEDGAARDIPLSVESDGIKRMVSLFFILRRVIADEGTLVFDELNMQLHPLLTKFVVDLFCREETRAQLIYTTHDTSILDSRYFRRDQIWFVEKEKFGRAQLYSLAEFDNPDLAALKEDYLGGAFGAIPMINAFDWGNDAHGEEK